MLNHKPIAAGRHNLLLLFFLLLTLSVGGCGPLTLSLGVTPAQKGLRTSTVLTDGPGTRDRVALIDISGLLVNADRPAILEQGENPVSLLHEQLAHAADDRRVKAVILRVNSPGGTVTASDMMHRDIARFRESTGKPVIGLMMDVAASGGYYVACGADRLIAHPTTVTGSVGVIIQTINVRPALERWGVRAEAFVSGPNKDVGSPLGTMTDEHRMILSGLVDDFHNRFVRLVRERRPGISAESFERVVDGRVVTGEQALELGLVDQLGDLHDAVALARELAGVERVEVVRYHRPLRYVASPYTHGSERGDLKQLNLLQVNVTDALSQTPVGIYYLWRPDAY